MLETALKTRLNLLIHISELLYQPVGRGLAIRALAFIDSVGAKLRSEASASDKGHGCSTLRLHRRSHLTMRIAIETIAILASTSDIDHVSHGVALRADVVINVARPEIVAKCLHQVSLGRIVCLVLVQVGQVDGGYDG